MPNPWERLTISRQRTGQEEPQERGVIAETKIRLPSGDVAETGSDTAQLVEALRRAARDPRLPGVTPEQVQDIIQEVLLPQDIREGVRRIEAEAGVIPESIACNPRVQRAIQLQGDLTRQKREEEEEQRSKKPSQRLLRRARQSLKPDGWGDPKGFKWR